MDALLHAPLHAKVFGKDGAAVRVMERSHRVPLGEQCLLWRQLYTLELVKRFRSALKVGVWAASQAAGPSQSMGEHGSLCFAGSLPSPQLGST